VDDLGASPAFAATFENTRTPFSGGDITVPVTVAFGDRDWILTKAARHRDRLPAHTRWISYARWGHVPMWVDPLGVARLILEGTPE
jgi:pimeloyl-ACP methyl ester carboxylesterase